MGTFFEYKNKICIYELLNLYIGNHYLIYSKAEIINKIIYIKFLRIT